VLDAVIVLLVNAMLEHPNPDGEQPDIKKPWPVIVVGLDHATAVNCWYIIVTAIYTTPHCVTWPQFV